MAKPKDYDFLLLGITGAGKSRTGNSILGRTAFKSKASMTSVTIKSKKDIAQLTDGRRLLVVDAPGLMDTGGNKEEGQKMFLNAINEAMVMNPEGYHVFLLVVKFGGRFTEEQYATIQHLKNVFGPDSVKTYCVVIVTGGDNFVRLREEEDSEVAEDTFEEWCRAQEGHFRELLDEVHDRVLLFNNFGNQVEKESQLQELLKLVDDTMLTGRRYTHEKFQKASAQLQELCKEDKSILRTQEAQDQTSLIFGEFERITLEPSFDVRMFKFEQILERIKELLKNIDEEKYKSNELEKIRGVLVDKQKYILDEMRILKLKKEAEENKRRYEEMIKQQACLELEAKRKELRMQEAFDDERMKQEKQEEVRRREEIRKHKVMEDEQRKQVEKIKREEDKKQKALQDEQKKLKQEYKNLSAKYEKVRDENNNKKATTLWGRITSWFSSWW